MIVRFPVHIHFFKVNIKYTGATFHAYTLVERKLNLGAIFSCADSFNCYCLFMEYIVYKN